SRLDYTLGPERVSVTFESHVPLTLRGGGKDIAPVTLNGISSATLTVTPAGGEVVPIEITLATRSGEPLLSASFTTNEDSRPRAIPLRRFLVPWAKLKAPE